MAGKRADRIPLPICASKGYFDLDKFLAWFDSQYPDRVVGTRTIARRCGLPRPTIQRILRGSQPNLYTYCRIMAFTELPVETFLKLRG